MKKALTTFLFWIPVLTSSWAQTQDTLYIVAGEFSLVDGNSTFGLSLSPDNSFTQTPPVIQIEPGEDLELTVINNDTRNHHLVATSSEASSDTLEPGGTAVFLLSNAEEGVHLLYDDLNDGLNRYLGLRGIIHVTDFPTNFYWSLGEHQVDWNTTLSSGGTPDIPAFNPQYWTINHLSAPETMSDTNAHVMGAVGDTLHIVVVNGGLMRHAVHFHGYHCKIVWDSNHPNYLGREKETFPLETLHCMILELVPDKPGRYPVHDHYLMATLANGNYVNGMMTMLHISE